MSELQTLSCREPKLCFFSCKNISCEILVRSISSLAEAQPLVLWLSQQSVPKLRVDDGSSIVASRFRGCPPDSRCMQI